MTERKRNLSPRDKKIALLVEQVGNHVSNTTHDPFLNRLRKEAFELQFEKMKDRQFPYYLIDLSPSERQKDILDTLFSVPSHVMTLMDSMTLKNPDTNSLLLACKNKMYSILGSEEWTRHVGFIRGFVDFYKQSDKVALELPVGNNCSLSAANKVYIRALNLGLIEPANENRVKIAKEMGMRYLPSFNIVFFGGVYYAKVMYDSEIFNQKRTRDLLAEIEKMIDIKTEWAERRLTRESQSFRRVEISESNVKSLSRTPVNHAHKRDPKKKW